LGTKINNLLQQLPDGSVLLSKWLANQGIPYELQQSYRKNGWFTSLGQGAMIRSGHKLLLGSAIHTLQHQAGMHIHLGGRSALSLQGYVQYLELYQKETLLFAPRGVKLPVWLEKNRWDAIPVLINSSMLPVEIGLVDFVQGNYVIKISGPARAIMECLELTPKRFDLYEAMEIMESLSSLKPDETQTLLEKCKSIKVKRLFLHFAERAGHPWVKYLNLSRVSLGKGKRNLIKGGVFVKKYQITLPEKLS
jgi:hypothetical protein